MATPTEGDLTMSLIDWPQLALEHLPGEVYIKDEQGRYLYANRAAAQRLGRAADALLGCTDAELLPAAEAQRREKADRAAFNGEAPLPTVPGELRLPLRLPDAGQDAAHAVLTLIGAHALVAATQLPALTDPLTGLPNDSLAFERITQAQQRSRRSGSFGILFYLELEQIDVLRGQHGQPAAERVQVEVAQRLREAVRAVDTVARIGEGQFAVLAESVGLDQAQGIDFASELKQRVERLLDQGCHFGGLSLALSAYTGSMLFRGLEPAAADLLRATIEIARARDS